MTELRTYLATVILRDGTNGFRKQVTAANAQCAIEAFVVDIGYEPKCVMVERVEPESGE